MSELIHRLSGTVDHMTESIKTALAVAGSTITVGVATILDKLPPILGIIATIIGIVLSLLLIRAQVDLHKSRKLDDQKRQLEIDELKGKELERIERAKDSPLRRDDDPKEDK